MKRLLILSICTMLLLCALSACGGGAEGGETLSTQEEIETPAPLSQAELEELFQKVFDSEGDIQSQEDAQITAELSAVKKAADTDTLPDDYEALYRSWREGQVTAWAAEVEQLKEEYKKILLADTDLTAAWDAGWDCYADYVDFDGDDMPELLCMFASSDEGYVLNVSMKVYGKTQNGISELCNDDFGIYTGAIESNWIRLCKNKENHQTYLAVSSRGMGSASPVCQSYYSLISGEWVCTDDFGFGRHEITDENGMLGYRLSWHIPSETDYEVYGDGAYGKEITDEEYDAAVSKYMDYQDILSSSTEFRFIEGGGFLPELLAIKLTVNGEPVELAVEPFVEKGVFMAPLRPVLEAMGVAVYAMSLDTYNSTWGPEVSWGALRHPGPPMVIASTKKQTLSIRTTNWLDDNFVYYHPGDYYADYGNENDTSPAPHMTSGNMVAPVSNMVEFFGGTVDWDPTARTLIVTGSIPEADRMSEEEIKSMATFSINAASSVMESNGYRFFSFRGNAGMSDSYKNGKKYWTFAVLPQGAELASLDGGEYGPTNATYVTVGNDGSVSWGEVYYESII